MLFQRERIHDLIEETLPLLRLHWQEIAKYKDIELQPDFERYMKLEDAGCLRVFTARNEEKKLVGYCAWFVNPNMHYRSSLQAVQDVLFVDPAQRGFGMKFINWCDGQLREEGVQVSYHHVKAKHNFGPMLEKMGYELVDLIYARRLD